MHPWVDFQTRPVFLGCYGRRKESARSNIGGRSGLHRSFEIAGGASSTTVAETWTYHAGRLRPRIQIYNAGNRFSFNNGVGLTAGAVSDAQIAAYRPLIERTNALLARECGLDLSDINITEYHQKP